jgi:hypothetical protein
VNHGRAYSLSDGAREHYRVGRNGGLLIRLSRLRPSAQPIRELTARNERRRPGRVRDTGTRDRGLASDRVDQRRSDSRSKCKHAGERERPAAERRMRRDSSRVLYGPV